MNILAFIGGIISIIFGGAQPVVEMNKDDLSLDEQIMFIKNKYLRALVILLVITIAIALVILGIYLFVNNLNSF